MLGKDILKALPFFSKQVTIISHQNIMLATRPPVFEGTEKHKILILGY